MQQHLLAVERRNLKVFGYGAKGMTLSMIEAAIALTDGRISADIKRILDIGRATLEHPVVLLDGIREAVAAIAARHPVVLITKGDLFHQEAKIARSGLTDLFPHRDRFRKGPGHLHPRAGRIRRGARRVRDDRQLAALGRGAGGEARRLGHPHALPRDLGARARARPGRRPRARSPSPARTSFRRRLRASRLWPAEPPHARRRACATGRVGRARYNGGMTMSPAYDASCACRSLR
jgi:hypothetical protein